MAGYSDKRLVQKLGVKAGCLLLAIDAPMNYRALLEPLPADVTLTSMATLSTSIVHVFVTERAKLNRVLATLREKLSPNAVVWVSWPKKASKMATDVTDNVIREIALPLGFVDVKVCAVTEEWSGLKLVVRKELR